MVAMVQQRVNGRELGRISTMLLQPYSVVLTREVCHSAYLFAKDDDKTVWLVYKSLEDVNVSKDGHSFRLGITTAITSS